MSSASPHIASAITREKLLKHRTRAEKITLINQGNPTWVKLSTTTPPSPTRSL